MELPLAVHVQSFLVKSLEEQKETWEIGLIIE
jgi:hypothetical protein